MAIDRRLKDKVTRLNLWPSPPPEEGFVGLAVLWLWESGDRELSDDDLDPVQSPLSILSHCPCSSAQHCADSSIQQLIVTIVRCMFGRDDMTTPRVTVTGDRRHHLMEETFEHPVTNIIVTTLCCPVILSSGDGGVQAAIISSASAARVHYTITAPEACLVMWQSDNMGS